MPINANASRTSQRRGGAFGILLFIIALAVLGAYIMFGNTIRDAIGIAPPAEAPEPAPIVAAAPVETVEAAPEPVAVAITSDPEPKAAGLKIESTGEGEDLSKGDAQATASKQTPADEQEVDKPAAPTTAVTSMPDDEEAEQLLKEANTAYHDFDWDTVEQRADRIVRLDASPRLKVRARDLELRAENLEDFMQRVGNDNDGLIRDLKVHPLLVNLHLQNARTTLAVPVRSINDKTPVDTTDPVRYVKDQLEAFGQIALLTPGKGVKTIATIQKQDQILDVTKANSDELIAEAKVEFKERLQRMIANEMGENPMALYEAASFAYQHRIDNVVVKMLDKALEQDPDLANTIRNDHASEFFEKLILQMEKGNKRTAASFLATLKRNYEDTDIYPQAQAYYKGNMKELLAAQQAEEERRRKERQRRIAERKRIAMEYRDSETIEKLEQEEQAIEERDSVAAMPVAAPANGDEAKADELFAEGQQIYAAAMEGGNTKARDKKYAEAHDYFAKALAIYNKLLGQNPDDGNLIAKRTRANQLRYATIKYRRF